MIKTIQLNVKPDHINNDELIKSIVIKKLNIDSASVKSLVLRKKSIDARKQVEFVLSYDVYINESFERSTPILSNFKRVTSSKKVLIIGAGPAGYFAALELIQHGITPIVIDRGKDVQSRRKDLRQIQQFGIVNSDSNYCFGEGGAGTYSDGKLYTRSVKRGDVESVLRLLVEHGAKPDILIDAHPHIGSNKLPDVVKAIRQSILDYGGEVHFNSKLTDFVIKNNQLKSIIVNEEKELKADAYILATGHSARDIFTLLKRRAVSLEAKPFALGVRVEHPQALIDEIQYRQSPRHLNLPAAKYQLTCQVDKRGVFSFCMCPGGFIVPASTSPGEIVINGMSLSRRDSEFANSGIVVAVNLDDILEFNHHEEFKALHFQKSIEQHMFQSVDGDLQTAPAQRLTDFINKKTSSSLLKTSYIPGLSSVPLSELLPPFISKRLIDGFKQFDRVMKGFVTEEAQIVAIESRTSSPIRIPRDSDSLEHISIRHLYPCGEGAGYAGGIVSAALDGQRVAKAISKRFTTL